MIDFQFNFEMAIISIVYIVSNKRCTMDDEFFSCYCNM